MKQIVIILSLAVLLFPYPMIAKTSEEMIADQMNILNWESIDQVVEKYQENEGISQFNLKQTATNILSGREDLSLTKTIKKFFQQIFKEFSKQLFLMRKLILICLLSSLLKYLSESFESKSIANLAFFATYINLILLLFETFKISLQIVMNTSDGLLDVLQALLPLFVGFYSVSGQVASIAVFHPMVLVSIQIFGFLINQVLLPLISFSAMLQIVNHISDENLLDQMSDVLKKSISWILKISAIILIGAFSFQSVGLPLLNKTFTKGAKALVSYVPVVGPALKGAVDSVMGFANLAKTGISAASIIFIILFSSLPFIKLLTMMISFKLTAALIEPISEKRIVNCISAVSDYGGMLLACLSLLIFMIIFLILFVLGNSM